VVVVVDGGWWWWVGGAQLGLVVYMGLHVGEENAAHECYGMAGALAEACLATSQSKLGKIFSHYRKKQYPNMESFFDELAKAFVEAFFPTHAATAFNFLFDVLDKLEENWKGASSPDRVRVRWCVCGGVCGGACACGCAVVCGWWYVHAMFAVRTQEGARWRRRAITRRCWCSSVTSRPRSTS
jgi:hypothetical protein